MRKIIIPIFLFLTFLCSPAIAEIITVTHTIKQSFGGSQSPDDARISAVAKAKREALEKTGVYIEALTVVKEAKVEKDEILALTAGVVKAEVVSQKNYHTEDAFGIEIIVNVIVDTSVLGERVKKLLQDRTHLTQIKDAQKREEELLQKVAKLEEENRKLTARKQNTKELKKQFQQASRGLTAMDWFDKAFALWVDGKYTDPKKAIEYLTNSIRLKPDLAEAYGNRGLAYSKDLRHYRRAIDDFDKAIHLKPDLADVYNNRGLTYDKLGQYQRAIKDYDEAIRLKPGDADAYYNRGRTYHHLKQYQRAINDFDEAISIEPNDAKAYTERGLTYGIMGQAKRAIKDLDEAIRLDPDDAYAYSNRGLAYAILGQDQLAIRDYNEAIRLKPEIAEAYINRGLAYIRSGNSREGCLSLLKACEFGNCKDYERMRQNGTCQ